MKHILFAAAILLCIGDAPQICFNPDLVSAVYPSKATALGRWDRTTILLNTGQSFETTWSVERVIAALKNVPQGG